MILNPVNTSSLYGAYQVLKPSPWISSAQTKFLLDDFLYFHKKIPSLYIYIFVWISDSAQRAISWCAPGVLCRLQSARLHVKLC